MFRLIGIPLIVRFGIPAALLLTGCQSTSSRSTALNAEKESHIQVATIAQAAAVADQSSDTTESLAGTSIQGMPGRVDDAPARRMSRGSAFCNT